MRALRLVLTLLGLTAPLQGEPPSPAPDLLVDVRPRPGCERIDVAAVGTLRPATCSIQAALDHVNAHGDPSPGDGMISILVASSVPEAGLETCASRPEAASPSSGRARENLRIENRNSERLKVAGCGGIAIAPPAADTPALEVRGGDGPVSVAGLELLDAGVAAVEVVGGGGPVALADVTIRRFRGHGIVVRSGAGEDRDLDLQAVQVLEPQGAQADGLHVIVEGGRHRIRIVASRFVGSPTSNDAVLVRARGDSAIELDVEEIHFSSLAGHAVQVAAGDRSRVAVTLRRSRLEHAAAEVGNGGVSVGATAEGTVDLVIEDNVLSDLGRRRSNAGLISLSADRGPFTARIVGNRISGSGGRAAITAIAEGAAPAFELAVEDNQVDGLAREAIYADLRGELESGRVVLRGNRIGLESPVGAAGAEGVVLRVRGSEKRVALVVEENTVRNVGRGDGDETLDVDVEDQASATLLLRANDLRSTASEAAVELAVDTEDPAAALCVELGDAAAGPAGGDIRLSAAPASRFSVAALAAAQRLHGDRLVLTGPVSLVEACH